MTWRYVRTVCAYRMCRADRTVWVVPLTHMTHCSSCALPPSAQLIRTASDRKPNGQATRQSCADELAASAWPAQDKMFKGYQMSTYNQILYTTLCSSAISTFGVWRHARVPHALASRRLPAPQAW